MTSATKVVSCSGAPAMRSRVARIASCARSQGYDQHPAEDGGADAVGAEVEARHDPEVAAASTERPEEVRVLVRARVHHAAVAEDDVGPDQGVDREAVPAHEPAEASAERQAPDARVRDLPRGHREPVFLRRAVELAEERAAADAHGRALRVDVDRAQRAQVDAEGPVAHGAPGHGVPARADGERKVRAACRADRGGDVLGVDRVRDRGGMAVDRAVPTGARRVVPSSPGATMRPTKPCVAQSGADGGGGEERGVHGGHDRVSAARRASGRSPICNPYLREPPPSGDV